MQPMKLGSINGFSKKKLDHRNIGATKELFFIYLFLNVVLRLN